MLIDTHTHIYCEEFDDDRDAVVQRAVDAGVALMLLPAIDSQTTERQQQLVDSYPALFRQMSGLHPTSVNDDYERELRLVERQMDEAADRYIAVGEIGLDLYWDTTYYDQQRDALMRQMRLAERCGKPVSLHIRNAYAEFFEVAKELNRATFRGVMHCFSGILDDALRAVEMGLYIGIGGVLTYKKSALPDIVRRVPLNRIVLETDAPYLAPVPMRGRRNESSYIAYVAQHLAQILEEPVDVIAEATTENAKTLFAL
ncbi:MAG: TatD family hydrolase [Bacteroidales bacterium]|nr:TatD family hydrolase [Bacteroidales bacterium]